MGTGPSVVEHVYDGDMQQLKETLMTRRKVLEDCVEDSDRCHEIEQELEEAVHAIVGMEIHSSQQFQQLQIALQMVLNVAPSLITSTGSNAAEWNAIHRACVTGNLAFIPFLCEQYGSFVEDHQRDAFGLLPVDLVPPELIKPRRKETMNRRDRGLELLFEAKNKTQQSVIKEIALDSKECTENEGKNGADNQEECQPECEKAGDEVGGYLQLQPVIAHFGEDALQVHGFVHELGELIRVRYHLPNAERFYHGYFQLIWRGHDEAFSEEPHYDQHVPLRHLLRGEQSTGSEPQASEGVEMADMAQQGKEVKTDPHIEQLAALDGFVEFGTGHLPEDAIIHILFVACDRYMMKRRVVLSTHACMVKAVSDEYSFEQPSAPEDSTHPAYYFTVAGEEFTHSSPEFAGLHFETLEEFEAYVHELKATSSKSRSPQVPDPAIHADREDSTTEPTQPTPINDPTDPDTVSSTPP